MQNAVCRKNGVGPDLIDERQHHQMSNDSFPVHCEKGETRHFVGKLSWHREANCSHAFINAF